MRRMRNYIENRIAFFFLEGEKGGGEGKKETKTMQLSDTWRVLVSAGSLTEDK